MHPDKRTRILCYLMPMLFLCSCGTSPVTQEISGDSAESVQTAQILSWEEIQTAAQEEVENVEVVDETAYYKLISMDHMYYYYIYDTIHTVVKQEGPLTRQPHLSLIGDHIVEYTLQAGTGLSTQWGYFYDVERDSFSRTFSSIYDAYNGYVVYRKQDALIVRDIFDVSAYYTEISDFQYPLSKAAEPFIEVAFVQNGTAIEVTYLTGEDFVYETETFVLSEIGEQR